jgi:hypothetical protein
VFTRASTTRSALWGTIGPTIIGDVPFERGPLDPWPRKYRLRIVGQCRILLLGYFGAAAARRATRPIATGTFAFPAFGTN